MTGGTAATLVAGCAATPDCVVEGTVSVGPATAIGSPATEGDSWVGPGLDITTALTRARKSSIKTGKLAGTKDPEKVIGNTRSPDRDMFSSREPARTSNCSVTYLIKLLSIFIEYIKLLNNIYIYKLQI
ncbi:hypothetical protein C7G84_19315 [Acinetobacter baumannii]|nr:hypothetical protein C7G84_19315 [Acinetobacter baumannii]